MVPMVDPRTATRKPHRKGTAAADIQDNRTQYLSRAVAKSLEILELLQTRQSSMLLNEVARQVKLSKTSAFRLLCTLQASGYLVQQEAGKYDLVSEVRPIVSSRFLIRLLKTATPVMSVLGRELRETINLAALFENRVEVIAVEESPEIIRMTNVIGHILPPNASSLGKTITAFQPDERREKTPEKLRPVSVHGAYHYRPLSITARIQCEPRAGIRRRSRGIGFRWVLLCCADYVTERRRSGRHQRIPAETQDPECGTGTSICQGTEGRGGGDFRSAFLAVSSVFISLPLPTPLMLRDFPAGPSTSRITVHSPARA